MCCHVANRLFPLRIFGDQIIILKMHLIKKMFENFKVVQKENIGRSNLKNGLIYAKVTKNFNHNFTFDFRKYKSYILKIGVKIENL